MARYKEKVGDPRKTNPIPLRLRDRSVPREYGGAEGWRGTGWEKRRKEILKRDKNRSTVSGFDAAQGNGLQVDHIMPFRIGGRNNRSNLRVTDYVNNPATDLAFGAGEKKPQRQRGF